MGKYVKWILFNKTKRRHIASSIDKKKIIRFKEECVKSFPGQVFEIIKKEFMVEHFMEN